MLGDVFTKPFFFRRKMVSRFQKESFLRVNEFPHSRYGAAGIEERIAPTPRHEALAVEKFDKFLLRLRSA